MKVNAKQLPGYLEEVLFANLVPLIKGSPAIGKSSIVHQVAEKYKLKLIDFRMAQADVTDFNGFPKILDSSDGPTTKAGYIPMNIFPLAGDPIPDGYEGWLLFLDEINSAPRSVQAAAYKLILDRMVGLHHLHKKVAIVGAGNKETDKAIVNTLSTAMQSRLAHFELIVDPATWDKWAVENNIDHRIRAFIKFKPEILFKFNPNHNNDTFPSPRTWEFCSR